PGFREDEAGRARVPRGSGNDALSFYSVILSAAKNLDGSCLRTALTCSRPVAAPQTRASLRATRAPIRRHPSMCFENSLSSEEAKWLSRLALRFLDKETRPF